MFEVAVVTASLKPPRAVTLEIPVKLEPSPSLANNVDVVSGKVIVLFVLETGAVTVKTPLPAAFPCILTFAI
jgi:hypothetical protein